MKPLAITILAVGIALLGFGLFTYNRSTPAVVRSTVSPSSTPSNSSQASAPQAEPSQPVVSSPIRTSSERTNAIEKGKKWSIVIDPRNAVSESSIRVSDNSEYEFRVSGQIVVDETIGHISPPGGRPIKRLNDPNGFPYSDGLLGQLLVRVGGTIYPLTTQTRIRFPQSGTIEFMINDREGYFFDNSGNYKVFVELVSN